MAATMTAQIRDINNMRLLGAHDMNGHGRMGEGIAIDLAAPDYAPVTRLIARTRRRPHTVAVV